MHLGMSKSKNSTSLYVLKSTYDHGFHSTKIVEKLGTVEELQEKLGGRDPIEWAKEHIAELNRLEKEEKREVMAKYSPVKRIEKNEQRTFNGGYLFLEKVYKQLRLPQLCARYKKKYKLNYNLDAIFSRLIYNRLLSLDTELSYYDSACLLIEQPDFTPRQITKALYVLAKEADHIRDYLYHSTNDLFPHDTSRLIYDTSIAMYESAEIKGMEKQVIPIKYYYDGNFIPVGYTINPEHLAHPRSTANERLIQKDFSEASAISLGSAGFTAVSQSTFKDWGIKNEYISIIPFDKMNAMEKKMCIEPENWHCTDLDGVFNLSTLKRRKEIQDLSRCYYKEAEDSGHRIILIYSIYRSELSRKERALSSLNLSPIQDHYDPYANYDTGGYFAIVTNIKDLEAQKLITMASMRNDTQFNFRILANEAVQMGDGLTDRQKIDAHFITCFAAEVVYHCLLKETNAFEESRAILDELQNMSFMKIQTEGYVPLYTRNDLTDMLHDTCGFRTDYEIISMKRMNRILKSQS